MAKKAKMIVAADEVGDLAKELAQDSFLEGTEFSAARESFNVDDLEEDEILEAGAEFHKFETAGDTLIGRFMSNVVAKEDKVDKDNETVWKKGDVIGYNLMQSNGEPVICPTNFSIAEHLANAKPGEIFKIKFKGKTQSSGGRQFSKFEIVKMKSKAK